MGEGDILLLHTDGLSEHHRGAEEYFPSALEGTVRAAKRGTAREIHAAITADLLAFSPPEDDISLVVIKRR
jgi:serine phosphatase RsbU (regulator of sigma subunit)